MDIVIAAITPVLVVAAIGYGLARKGLGIEGEPLRFVVAQIATPALVFGALAKLSITGETAALYALACVTCIAGYAVVGWTLLKTTGLAVRTYLQPLMFGNVGNLGLPLAMYAFGDPGLGYASILFAINVVGNFTVGQAIAAGQANWLRVLQSPTFYAAAAGVLCSEMGVQLPAAITNTLTVLGNIVIPMMLMMMGTSLARIRVTSIGRAAWLGAFRLAMGTGVAYGVTVLFGFTGVAQAVMILLSSSPPAVYNYIFAVIWKTEPEQVASLVVVTTLMAAIWAPLVLAFLVK